MKKLVSFVLFTILGLAVATVATPTAKINAAPIVQSQCCDFPPPPPDCPPTCSPAAR